MSDIIEQFSELLPMEVIRVGPETKTFEVIEYDDGGTSMKHQYVPNKAPFIEIENVVGQVDGESFSFTESVDYSTKDTDNDGRLETIDFSIGGENPDDNTEFEITYTAQSVIKRFVESYGDELHNLEQGLDTVINSHYVDFASETGFIDNFEDEETVEYTQQAGVESEVTVQRTRSVVGDWALELIPDTVNSPVRIASSVGLQRYPRSGDTLQYYTYLTDDGCVSSFDFMWDDSDGERYYRVVLDGTDDEFRIQKKDGSTKSDSIAVVVDSYVDEWLEVEVEIGNLGTIEATLSDSDGATVGSVSIVDTAYKQGGIRWEAECSTSGQSVFVDGAEITQRLSRDLDRIGALFGELGLRRGRSDTDYAQYLKSIVQSFSGRGRVDGIRFAVGSALNLFEDNVRIREDFQNTEYSVVIEEPWVRHKPLTVEQLAELADPSGVSLDKIRYELLTDTSVSTDTVSALIADASVDDTLIADDSVLSNITLLDPQDTLESSDSVTSNVTVANTSFDRWDTNSWDGMEWNGQTDADTQVTSDLVESDITDTVSTDSQVSADSVTTEQNIVAFDVGSWDTMRWA